MKFFIKIERSKYLRLKRGFYDFALFQSNLTYTSFFYCMRLDITPKKSSKTRQQEFILQDVLFWENLRQINRFRKITFSNLNKHLSQKRVKNLTLLERFLNLFLKDGLKTKYLKYLNKGIQQVYHTLYFFWQTLTFQQYIYIDSLFSSEKHNYDIFPALLVEMSDILEPMFQLRVEKVNKQFKKVIKKRFITKLVYVKPYKRLNLALKAIILYLNLFKPYKIHERLYHSFFKTLVEHKNSYLYKRKLHLYNLIAKKHRVKEVSVK